ncbi:hypothetical protein N7G274_004812 [Stereocaulon virgatum]|uniref:Uncharacterized protein n=1 Tax=Stereocaulon virgatum TaxID=373712 RepID=A0ABR4AG01_9LECA
MGTKTIASTTQSSAAATSTTQSTAAAASSYPIPLTTIFTPPPSCLSVITYDGTSFWQNGIGLTGDPNCYPASFDYIGYSYYTPGLCPYQWTSVGEFGHSSGLDAACCPSSYFLYTTIGRGTLNNACASLISTDLTNVFQASTKVEGPIPISHQLKTISQAEIPATSKTVWADVIEVQWQSSNTKVISLMASTALAAASSSSSSSSAAPASRASGIPVPTSTDNSSNISSNSGLSAGAKAGIGVAVVLGVLALAAAAFFLIRYRKRRRADQYQENYTASDHNQPEYYELAQKEAGQAVPEDMDRGIVNELPGTILRAELYSEVPDRDKDDLITSTPTPRHSKLPST